MCLVVIAALQSITGSLVVGALVALLMTYAVVRSLMRRSGPPRR